MSKPKPRPSSGLGPIINLFNVGLYNKKFIRSKINGNYCQVIIIIFTRKKIYYIYIYIYK